MLPYIPKQPVQAERLTINLDNDKVYLLGKWWYIYFDEDNSNMPTVDVKYKDREYILLDHDWFVEYPDGKVEILPEEEFELNFKLL